MTDFEFAIKVKIGFLANAHLNISGVDFSFHLGNVHVNISGLEGGQLFENMINEIINTVGTEEMNDNQDQVSEDAKKTVIKLGNSVLNNMTLQDLLDLIHGNKSKRHEVLPLPIEN